MTARGGADDRIFCVAIDHQRLDEDLAHNTPGARAVANAGAARFERHGAPRSLLHPCQAEDRHETNLPGCVKTYLPDVNGAWGMVMALRASDAGDVYLEFLAFGQRHPTRSSSLSVYQVAAARLRRL